jgi:hypothetical protein
MTSAEGVPAVPMAGCLAEVAAPVGSGSEDTLTGTAAWSLATTTGTEAAAVFWPFSSLPALS